MTEGCKSIQKTALPHLDKNSEYQEMFRMRIEQALRFKMKIIILTILEPKHSYLNGPNKLKGEFNILWTPYVQTKGFQPIRYHFQAIKISAFKEKNFKGVLK
jgi:hypothetical protein